MFRKKTSIKDLLPPPVKAEHAEYSMILSAKDSPAKLTTSLLKTCLSAIGHASEVDLGDLGTRNRQAADYGNLWPGEHYRLLMGFVIALQPKTVIEIGTSTGLSALCVKKHLRKDGKIVTFDVVDWTTYPATLLDSKDFLDGRLIQHVADLSSPETLQKYKSLLEDASLIFIDATHDGQLERKIMDNLKTLRFKSAVYIFMDDIRVWTMLKMWREIDLPKIDLTSFGHWSGTGIVEMAP